MKTDRRQFLLMFPAAAAVAARLADVKLGVTSDEIDDDPAVAGKFLREFGIKYAEIRNLWGKYNTELPPEKVREAREAFKEHGVGTSVVATAFFRGAVPKDDAALEKEWKLLSTAFERADILGTKTIRTFAFTYRASEKPDPAVYPRIYELQREAARRARKGGYRLAIETLANSYVWNGEQAGDLLKNVKEDNLGITWDPNNAASAEPRPFPDGYKKMDPARIFHVHLRDYKREANGRITWTAVGEGEFDNVGQIQALRRDGFRGTYTLETHWRSPQGKAHATKVSLEALLKVIEKV